MKNRNIFRKTILLMISLTVMVYAEGTRTLVMGDGKANRLNMVFLAEGYTQSQQSRFIEDVRQNMDIFFRYQPWSNFRKMCNVYAISVVSNDSGADHPAQDIWKDTYFESSFTIGSLSTVVIGAKAKVDSILKEHVPDHDFACVIVNDPAYGGKAVILPLSLCIFSRHS